MTEGRRGDSEKQSSRWKNGELCGKLSEEKERVCICVYLYMRCYPRVYKFTDGRIFGWTLIIIAGSISWRKDLEAHTFASSPSVSVSPSAESRVAILAFVCNHSRTIIRLLDSKR